MEDKPKMIPQEVSLPATGPLKRFRRYLATELLSPRIWIRALLVRTVFEVVILAGGALILISPTAFTIVHEHELATRHRLGTLRETSIEPGLKWYWPVIDSVHRYDTRPRQLKIIQPVEEGDPLGIGIETRDGWNVGVLTTIEYSLNKDKSDSLVKRFAADDSKAFRSRIEERIELEVRHAIQNLGPQYYIGYLLQNRDEMLQNVQVVLGLASEGAPGNQRLPSELKQAGIEVHDQSLLVNPPRPLQGGETLSDLGIVLSYVQIEFDVPNEYIDQQSEFAAAIGKLKQRVADMDIARVENEHEKLKAEGEKVIAQAEADRMRILAEAKNLISWQMLIIEKWDGHMPVTLVINSEMMDAMILKDISDVVYADHVASDVDKLDK